MDKIKLLICILLFQSCMGSDSLDAPITNTPNSNAPVTTTTVFGKWDTSLLPNEPKISVDFTPEEITSIEKAMDDWSDSVGRKLLFFKTPSVVTPNKELTKLDDYKDSEMGIYKSTKWYSEIGPYALAITQYWGVRMNPNTPQEYIDIVHADIIVNYHDHSFSLTPVKSQYDLQSVLVHELGHFIGLSHQASKSSSVMASSISARAIRRTLSTLDISTITSNYGLDGTTPAIVVAKLESNDDDEAIEEEPQFVRGIFELRVDGSCGHFTVSKEGKLESSPSPKTIFSSY